VVVNQTPGASFALRPLAHPTKSLSVRGQFEGPNVVWHDNSPAPACACLALRAKAARKPSWKHIITQAATARFPGGAHYGRARDQAALESLLLLASLCPFLRFAPQRPIPRVNASRASGTPSTRPSSQSDIPHLRRCPASR